MARFLLVDEDWMVLGEHEAQDAEWSVGEEFSTADGQRFAIIAIVPSVDDEARFVATWTVEPA
jgi:hypothetical protein